MLDEESTPPNLVELAGRSFAAAGRHDLDALMSFYAADAVWDMSDVGVGTFEGTTAIRSFFEDWWATWEDHHQEIREFQDFGNGVLFAAIQEDGRLPGSDRRVEHTRGWVATWMNDLVVRMTAYLDIDEARAAAGRLAHERG
jgi:ketosteroid isomerase-like protein